MNIWTIWVLKTTYVILENVWVFNYFESLKLLMCFWNLLWVIAFDIWKTDYFLNHLWYICKIKVWDLCTTYYFMTMKLLQLFWNCIVYYNFWRLILHLVILQIYCLIELIRILVIYWVVNSPIFPLQFQIMKNNKF